MSDSFLTSWQLVLQKTHRERLQKYLIGEHASERLEERGIMEWQAVSALEDGALIVERPNDQPNPAIEVRQTLPDGADFKAVWSLLRQSGVAKFVTVHFFDGE